MPPMEKDPGPIPKDDPDPNVPTPNAPTGLWGRELELVVELVEGLNGFITEEGEMREEEAIIDGVPAVSTVDPTVPDCIANMSFSVTYSGNVCTNSSGP